MQKEYQRKYLRAPYRETILFSDRGFVFKAQALNISERGMLLDYVGHFPLESHSPFLIKVPIYPKLKNFNLGKLEHFSAELFKPSFIRMEATVVRSLKAPTSEDAEVNSQIGLRIDQITPQDQKKIAHYVEDFASNLIYLQILIDTINSDKSSLGKARLLAEILGYEKETKISLLRKEVEHDYRSLQWL